MQSGLLNVWETAETESGESVATDAAFAELYRTIQVVSHVARTGGSLVDIAEGRSPVTMLEPHQPAILFEGAVRPFLALRARRRPELKLIVDVPQDLPTVYVDRVAFFRATSNVIHNAYKFTQQGQIHIRAYPQSEHVVFAIADSGPGIPVEALSQIGTYRFRAPGTQKIPGQGIGLWVTRQLVEAMGGFMRVESLQGAGSTFYLGFATQPVEMSLAGARDDTYTGDGDGNQPTGVDH
jgi:signal transduction histidine kinase